MKNKTLDPMKRMVTRSVPFAAAGEQQSIYVSLNRKNYLIPRAKPVTVPLAVWEIVERILEAERIQEAEIRNA